MAQKKITYAQLEPINYSDLIGTPPQASILIKYFVAASDANIVEKAYADAVCDGTSDEVQINAALSGSVHVTLSSGHFSTAATIAMTEYQRLSGQGIGITNVTGAATGFHVIHMGNRQSDGVMRNAMVLENMSVSSAGGANSFDTVWVDGMGTGSCIVDVKASEGRYNFRLTDVDQSYFTGIKAYNSRLAGIYLEAGLENTWGNVAFYSPSSALSDNNSIAFLLGASAAQTNPNKFDRVSVYGALMYASTGLTGTVGMQDTVGTTSFKWVGTLFENPRQHVVFNNSAGSLMSFDSCTFLQNQGTTTDIFNFQNANHQLTIDSCRFQQATNAFNGQSGYSKITFLGQSTNQGNIANFFTGNFGLRQGTDTAIAGNGALYLGTDNERYENVFTNQLRIHNFNPAAGLVWTATDTNGNGSWASVPTPDLSSYATNSSVDTKIANLVNGSPTTLDTLNELATALGDDPNFATTVTNSIATKLAKSANLSDLASPATARSNLGLATVAASGAYTDLSGRPTLGSLAAISPTGTASATTYLRGDNSWATITAGDAYLANTQTFTGVNTFSSAPTLSAGANVANNTGVVFGGGSGNATTIKTGTDGTFLFDVGGSVNSRFKLGGTTSSNYIDFTPDYSSSYFKVQGNKAVSTYNTTLDDGSGNLSLKDGATIAVGTTTGTKFGTSASQKLAFFGQTPTTQQSGTADLGVLLASLGLRASGSYTLSTGGTASFTGLLMGGNYQAGVNTVTGATTLGLTYGGEVNFCSASSAAYNITLPNTTTPGYRFVIIKTDSSTNAITVLGTINGATNYVLSAQWKRVALVSTSTSGVWYIVENN